MRGSDRYVIISADCHGGADARTSTAPTCPRAATSRSTSGPGTTPCSTRTCMGEEGRSNWDSDRRLADLEADGIVAEVIFPNTIPPFYPEHSLKVQMPGATEGDLELRWAGLRAHNRWLADFCAAAPGRRAGIAQIMLHDVDAAVAEIEWAAEAGMTRRHPAARHPAGLGPRAAVLAASTSRSGRPARRPDSRSTTTAAAPCRPWATSRSSRSCSCSRSPGGPTGPCGTSSSAA